MTINLNNKIRQIFVKDYGLPIQIFDYSFREKLLFDYYLDLYDPYYQTRDKYQKLIQAIQTLGLQKFDSFFNETQKHILDEIKQTKAFEEFKNHPLDYKKSLNKVRRDKIYNYHNTDCYVISIDLVKANFQAMKIFNPELVKNTDNYRQFFESFGDIPEYFIQSKKLRQVIFGSMAPKQQQKIQENILNIIVEQMLDQNIELNNIRQCSTDEILVLCYSLEELNIVLDKIQQLEANSSYDLRIEPFRIFEIFKNKGYFAKTNLTGNLIDFKCVPSHHMPQVVKTWEGKPVEQLDLLFLFEKEIAQFSIPLEDQYQKQSKYDIEKIVSK